MSDTNKGRTLLHLARAAIARELGFRSDDLPRTSWLEQPGATFVTLTLHGRMHGCIGSLEARLPLIDDVRQNAIAAAFEDPRYPPLTREEFADVVIDVALLSTPEEIHFRSEQDALQQLHPGLDGVTLEYDPAATATEQADSGLLEQATVRATAESAPLGRPNRATFLPHAWADLPEPRDYLAELKTQAGLPEDFWSDDIKLSRYTVKKWHEVERQHG
ncbi:MAG: AmmeMemoRadiSam system protein A [Nitrosomonadales bacterium]|nr:AmmeMemoRadiSam system protein A [Nitrosomonadales bacterium]